MTIDRRAFLEVIGSAIGLGLAHRLGLGGLRSVAVSPFAPPTTVTAPALEVWELMVTHERGRPGDWWGRLVVRDPALHAALHAASVEGATVPIDLAYGPTRLRGRAVITEISLGDRGRMYVGFRGQGALTRVWTG
jgi:hypothetical protein